MKYLTTILGLFVAVSFAHECNAQRPNRDGNRQAQQGQRQGPSDPSEMAKQMMAEFDEDGDGQLSTTELTAMFTSMRDRRSRAGQGNQQGRRGEGRNRAVEGQPGEKAGGKEGQRGQRGQKKGKEASGEDSAQGPAGKEGRGDRAKGEGRKGGKRGSANEDAGSGFQPKRPASGDSD